MFFEPWWQNLILVFNGNPRFGHYGRIHFAQANADTSTRAFFGASTCVVQVKRPARLVCGRLSTIAYAQPAATDRRKGEGTVKEELSDHRLSIARLILVPGVITL